MFCHCLFVVDQSVAATLVHYILFVCRLESSSRCGVTCSIFIGMVVALFWSINIKFNLFLSLAFFFANKRWRHPARSRSGIALSR